MLEGSVAEDFSHLQNRKFVASCIFMSTMFHKEKMIQQEKWKEA